MEFINEIEMFEFMEKYFYAGALSDILDEMGYRECAVSPHAMIRPLYADAVCAGRGRFGMLLWVKGKDYVRAAKALKAK